MNRMNAADPHGYQSSGSATVSTDHAHRDQPRTRGPWAGHRRTGP